MIKWALRRAIDKFERGYNYDASYMRDMIDASPRAAWLFSRVTALGRFRRDVPIEAWCAAGLTAGKSGVVACGAFRWLPACYEHRCVTLTAANIFCLVGSLPNAWPDGLHH